MNGHQPDDLKRIAKDVHLLASPFRLLQQLFAVTIGVLFAPVLLVWLLIASHLDPSSVGIAMVPIGVFGPLVFAVWFAGVVRWVERKNEKYPELGSRAGKSRASSLAAYFVGVGYLGVLVSLMLPVHGLAALWALVIGLFSPAILFAVVRVLRNTDMRPTPVRSTKPDNRMDANDLEMLAKKLEIGAPLTEKEQAWMKATEKYRKGE